MMQTLFLLSLPFLASAHFLFEDASPLSKDCPGAPNTLTPWSGDLVKVNSVANGSLYTAGDGDDKIYGQCVHAL